MLANKFYKTFYTHRHIHLDARIWNEEGKNEVILLSCQALDAKIDELILVLLQLLLLPE